MAVNLVVSGLPGDVTFPHLLNSFRVLLKKNHMRQFWIRELSDIDGDLKQMTLELTNNADARRARNLLDNMPYRYKMMEFPLQAYIPEDSTSFVNEDELEDWGRRRRQKRTRARSRSPGYRQEASKLDMEIELLRKQRQVIEEERRLIMEQKKLEMIKEYGPSASRGFDDYQDYEPPRKRRQPEPVPKRTRQKSPPKVIKVHKKPALPLFFQPCKKLIGQMKPIIEKDTTPEEVEILIKLIRAAIRKDLAIALENKDYMKHGEIIHLYRERHPKEQDEAFVAKILANIRASFLTDVNVKAVKEEKVDENDAKDKTPINEKGDEGNEAENIPENGENVTDAATDGVVNETTQEPENSADNSVVEIKTNDTVVDVTDTTLSEEIEKEKEDELLDGEPNPADCVEQTSPKNSEVPDVAKVQ